MAQSRFRTIARACFQPVYVARVIFVLLTTWCGMMLAGGSRIIEAFGFRLDKLLVYALIAFFAGVVITVVEYATDAISSHKLLIATFGGLMGLLFSSMFYKTIPSNIAAPESVRMACNLFFGYFGMILAIKHAQRFHLGRLRFFLSPAHERPKILDTSVIIDGRIREMIGLQVVAGPVIVPEFVLTEIQAIADSHDPIRRPRGRRGLDVLQQLRETCKTLEILEKDYADIQEVDQKLVRLAREIGGDLITNDYNLQRVARLHGLMVININEISDALKPAVYIGETFNLAIVREGKENGQGVGYLEDGTMVVVDDARAHLDQEIPVIVSSILQTASGRLIFARPLLEPTAQAKAS